MPAQPSVHARLREARKQQAATWRTRIVLALAVLLVAVLIATTSQTSRSGSSSNADANTTSADAEHKLRPLANYGFGQLPLSKQQVESPCPLKDRQGSALECFFEDIFAFTQKHGSVSSDRELGSEGTYGEITLAGVTTLLSVLQVGPDDGFYDLGSGAGKVVLQALLTSQCQRAVGVELSQKRHLVAQEAGVRVVELFGADAQGRLDFRHGDAAETQLADATIVFMCSLCFPDGVMRRISERLTAAATPGTVVLTLKPFDHCHPGMSLIGHIPLPMTWTKKFEMLVYVVSPPREVFQGLLGILPGELGAWRGALSTTVGPEAVDVAMASFTKQLQAHGHHPTGSNLSVTALQQVLQGVAPSWTPRSLETLRLIRLTAAWHHGQPAQGTQLALDPLSKDRARLLDVRARFWNEESLPIVGEDMARFILSRILGDDDEALSCVLADLWPRTPPALEANEEKLVFSRWMVQGQVTPQAYRSVLAVLQPPLGSQDVLVEPFSGGGQLTIQTRLTTSVSKTVGIEAAPSRHKLAEQALQQIRMCSELFNGSDDNHQESVATSGGCPQTLPLLPGWDGVAARSGEVEFVHSRDPVGTAAAWPGATVIYALTAGWPRSSGSWRLAFESSLMLLPGATILANTPGWPGCQRGLLEVAATETMPNRRVGRTPFPFTDGAHAYLVIPTADPTHELFKSWEDTSDFLKDHVLTYFDPKKALGYRWREHFVPLEDVVRLLGDPGPLFKTAAPATALATSEVRRARLQAMLGHWSVNKAAMRGKPHPGNSISLYDVISVLQAGLHGTAKTPFECLAADLDAAARPDEERRRQSVSRSTSALQPASSPMRAAALSSLLGPLLQIGGEFTTRWHSNVVLVLGDCRVASLLLLNACQTGRRVRCLPHDEIITHSHSRDGGNGHNTREGAARYWVAQGQLGMAFHPMLQGCIFELPAVLEGGAPSSAMANRELWADVTAVILAPELGTFTPDQISASETQYSDALVKFLPPDMLVVSLLELHGLGAPLEVRELSQLWDDRGDGRALSYRGRTQSDL